MKVLLLIEMKQYWKGDKTKISWTLFSFVIIYSENNYNNVIIQQNPVDYIFLSGGPSSHKT